MPFMVLYVLDNVGQMSAVLDAWEQAGAPGITILDTTGVERLRRAGLRDDLPLLPSLSDLLADENVYHKTLMSVVEDEAVIDRIVEATQKIVGDFSNHHTGLLCVLPLLRVYGLDKPPHSNSGKS
jgi:nitrogen regulatory protein P-II 1